MRFIFFALLLLVLSGCKNPTVIFETEIGNFEAEIFLDKAPITSENFLNHIKENNFASATFYRTVKLNNQPNNNIKILVVQGGLDVDENKFPQIIHEPTNKTEIKHLDGTISMARNEPGTATTEFFICIGNQPELDFNGKRNPDGMGFAAFGKVIKGMNVVKKIHSSNDSLQRLKPPIKILSIK